MMSPPEGSRTSRSLHHQSRHTNRNRLAFRPTPFSTSSSTPSATSVSSILPALAKSADVLAGYPDGQEEGLRPVVALGR